MSSIAQYIDLYRANSAIVDTHSEAPLNALRSAALEALSGAKLPRRGEEDYEATDLNAIFAPDYGVNARRIDMLADTDEAFRCDVPNMSTSPVYFFNDVYHHNDKPVTGGVIITSLRNAAVLYPDLVSQHYGKLAPLSDPQVALNTLLVQDGLFVYVPQGKTMERTLQIVNIINSPQPVMALRRVLVVVERGASARILVCDHTQSREVPCLSNQVIEISAGEGSTVDYYDFEATAPTSSRASSLWARQYMGSNLLIDSITLACGTTRNNFHIDVVGEQSETKLLGMAIASGEQHIDNHTYIGHSVGHCRSNELFKYVVDDRAVGSFAGKILVAPNSPKVEAYQSNRNICAAPTAKMHTKPQLEIYTDDVKCSHGATVGQLDQEALFYMQTRGVPLDEARVLLMQAFMSDVIDAVRIDALRDRLHNLVEKRFTGSMAGCGDCAGTCNNKIRNH